MWLLYACGSAVFAGMTAILAKIGIEGVDSTLATALRTIIVLIFSWLMVLVAGSYTTISSLSSQTFLFLLLSGLATGASWLCYFKALQVGDVNKVTPVDKSSTILTVLLAFLFLGEEPSLPILAGLVLLGAGTYLMIQKKEVPAAPVASSSQGKSWFFYAAFSAIFAALTAILGKIGIQGVESNLGTALRTIVVLVMAWGIVFMQKKTGGIRSIQGRSWLFIILSGLATGLSWLCYYRALQEGKASIVVPIDKLSIVLTVAFSRFVLKEKLSLKAFMGLCLIVGGTALMLV